MGQTGPQLQDKTAVSQTGMFSTKIHWSLQNETNEQPKANRLHHCLPEALPELCSKPPSHHGARQEQLRNRSIEQETPALVQSRKPA